MAKGDTSLGTGVVWLTDESAKCDKYGHYASCCKGEKSLKPGKQSTSQQSRGRQRCPGKGRQANFVEGPFSLELSNFENSSKNDAYAFTIEEQTCAL